MSSHVSLATQSSALQPVDLIAMDTKLEVINIFTGRNKTPMIQVIVSTSGYQRGICERYVQQ
jgi:hypothetical protein